VVICRQGYSSSLAAQSLRSVGLWAGHRHDRRRRGVAAVRAAAHPGAGRRPELSKGNLTRRATITPSRMVRRCRRTGRLRRPAGCAVGSRRSVPASLRGRCP
jgi:hypothetical protein